MSNSLDHHQLAALPDGASLVAKLSQSTPMFAAVLGVAWHSRTIVRPLWTG